MARKWMPTFTGMEGLPGLIKGPFVRSVTAADRSLRKYRIISVSGDNGAINVWRRRDGQYGVERFRTCITQDFQVVKTKKAAMGWLKDNIEKVR